MKAKSCLTATLLILTLFFMFDIAPVSFESPRKLVSHVIDPTAKPSPSVTIDIRDLGDGVVQDNIRQGAILDVIAKVTGSVSSVTFRIDGGSEITMTRWGTSDRYSATWTVTQALGTHTVTVTAKTGGKRPKTYTDTATVHVVSGYEAELSYEIDYMYDVGQGKDFKPSQNVLDYWIAYWDARCIIVHPVIDDPVPWQYEISDPWTYEAAYNDFSPHTDSPSWYNSTWKWMLWADYDVDHGIGGSTYVELTGNGDCLGGNYITIYKGMVDEYYAPQGMQLGGDIVVAMHEAGHSIGIARLQSFMGRWYEVYDNDYYAIMSTMRSENAGFTNHWYYSYNYWDTRNLGYY